MEPREWKRDDQSRKGEGRDDERSREKNRKNIENTEIVKLAAQVVRFRGLARKRGVRTDMVRSHRFEVSHTTVRFQGFTGCLADGSWEVSSACLGKK